MSLSKKAGPQAPLRCHHVRPGTGRDVRKTYLPYSLTLATIMS
jgi:hypothetical protein